MTREHDHTSDAVRNPGLVVLGTGRALPSSAWSSAALDEKYGLPEGRIESLTGVNTRYFVDTENQIDLAEEAAQAALDDAVMNPDAIDLIISACAVPYQPIPTTAPRIMHALQIKDGQCYALDVNTTCLSFISALEVANGLIASGTYRNALIVSSELASRGLPWQTEPHVAGLFGDGAGAAVVTASDISGIVSARFETYSSAYDACEIGAGGTRFDFRTQADDFAAHSQFTMDGKELFRVTAKHFANFTRRLLEDAGSTQSEIDLVIPHQASPGALMHMIKLTGFAPSKVVNIAADFGNQIAASLPFTLDYARKTGLARSGNRILMLGTSAGVSFGGMVLDL